MLFESWAKGALGSSWIETFSANIFTVVKLKTFFIDFHAVEILKIVSKFTFSAVGIGVKCATRIHSKGGINTLFVLEKVPRCACGTLPCRFIIGVT